jgi:hypothetical protein
VFAPVCCCLSLLLYLLAFWIQDLFYHAFISSILLWWYDCFMDTSMYWKHIWYVYAESNVLHKKITTIRNCSFLIGYFKPSTCVLHSEVDSIKIVNELRYSWRVKSSVGTCGICCVTSLSIFDLQLSRTWRYKWDYTHVLATLKSLSMKYIAVIYIFVFANGLSNVIYDRSCNTCPNTT